MPHSTITPARNPSSSSTDSAISMSKKRRRSSASESEVSPKTQRFTSTRKEINKIANGAYKSINDLVKRIDYIESGAEHEIKAHLDMKSEAWRKVSLIKEEYDGVVHKYDSLSYRFERLEKNQKLEVNAFEEEKRKLKFEYKSVSNLLEKVTARNIQLESENKDLKATNKQLFKDREAAYKNKIFDIAEIKAENMLLKQRILDLEKHETSEAKGKNMDMDITINEEKVKNELNVDLGKNDEEGFDLEY